MTNCTCHILSLSPIQYIKCAHREKVLKILFAFVATEINFVFCIYFFRVCVCFVFLDAFVFFFRTVIRKALCTIKHLNKHN